MMIQRCQKAKIRAVKTVRAIMPEVVPLADRIPNFRLIHLFRDPRPVLVSRNANPYYRSVYAGTKTKKEGGGDMVKEASVYCPTVVADIRLRQKTVESDYPGSVTQAIYEDFVPRPVEYAQAMYAFMNETLPPNVKHYIDTNTSGQKWKFNALLRMHKWKESMTYDTGDKVKAACSDFYNLVNFTWPY